MYILTKLYKFFVALFKLNTVYVKFSDMLFHSIFYYTYIGYSFLTEVYYMNIPLSVHYPSLSLSLSTASWHLDYSHIFANSVVLDTLPYHYTLLFVVVHSFSRANTHVCIHTYVHILSAWMLGHRIRKFGSIAIALHDGSARLYWKQY